ISKFETCSTPCIRALQLGTFVLADRRRRRRNQGHRTRRQAESVPTTIMQQRNKSIRRNYADRRTSQPNQRHLGCLLVWGYLQSHGGHGTADVYALYSSPG